MIRIGTRKSKLSLIQTEIVKNKILELFPQEDVEIVPIITKGDIELERSLDSFGGKGVFTEEIEEKLLEGTIDIAVHSAKDIPMEFPEGLTLGAVIEREDPRDVMVTLSGIYTKDLPKGSVIGTGSLRRELQVKKINSRVIIKNLRGNVQTRLQKLKDGLYDGIILAAAGLKRLGLDHEEGIFYEYFDVDKFAPAAGQGILALEIREGSLGEIMSALNNKKAETALRAERRFLETIGGSCNAPCGVLWKEEEQGATMLGMYSEHMNSPKYLSMETQGKTVEEALLLAEKLAKQLKIKKVSLVGAGPGRKNTLSIKALEKIKEAQVIVYDNLISESILNEASQNAELIYVGKRANAHSMKQEEINRLLIELALSGKKVLRLKGGDPFIFGRGGEEALALYEQEIPFEIIPGISSAYSVPGGVGIPVTHRGISSSVHVITGHEDPKKQKSCVDYNVLAKEEGTLVFLMGLHNLEEITNKLIENGKHKDTPAAVIERGGSSREKVVVATLETISEKVRNQKLKTPAIIVVGETISLREKILEKEALPLSGKRILITGTPALSKKMSGEFESLGAEAVSLSLIRTRQIVSEENNRLLQNLEQYGWIVFTSSVGVREFFKALDRLMIDRRALGKVKFAVIGEATGETLRNHGYFCDFIPSEFCVKKLAKEWSTLLGQEEKVLIVRSKGGSKELDIEFKKKDISYDVAVIYETYTDYRRRDELHRIVDDVDYITVTSGSNGIALAEMLEDKKIQTKLVVIGPVSKRICEERGLKVYLMAERFCSEGIVEIILKEQNNEGKPESFM